VKNSAWNFDHLWQNAFNPQSFTVINKCMRYMGVRKKSKLSKKNSSVHLIAKFSLRKMEENYTLGTEGAHYTMQGAPRCCRHHQQPISMFFKKEKEI